MTDEKSSGTDTEKMRQYLEGRVQDRLFIMERAEKRMKARTRLMGFGLLVALGFSGVALIWPGALSMGGGFGGPETLTVEHLILEDADGNARGEWRVDEEGNSRLTLLDRQGKTRLSLSVLSGGWPGLSLIDMSGVRRAVLGLMPDQTTNLVLADGTGTARAVLGLGVGDATSLVFADADGFSRVGLGLDGAGVGTMMLPGEEPEGAGSDEGEEGD